MESLRGCSGNVRLLGGCSSIVWLFGGCSSIVELSGFSSIWVVEIVAALWSW